MLIISIPDGYDADNREYFCDIIDAKTRNYTSHRQGNHMQFDIPTFTPDASHGFIVGLGLITFGVAVIIAIAYLLVWLKNGAFKEDLKENGDVVGGALLVFLLIVVIFGFIGTLVTNSIDINRYENKVAQEITQGKNVTIIESGNLGFSHGGLDQGFFPSVVSDVVVSIFSVENNKQYDIPNNSLNQGIVIMDNVTGSTVKCQTYAHDGKFIFSCNNDKSDQLVSLDTALQTANSGINISK